MTDYKLKRAVVLGGAGFVGSHLCERLLEEGCSEVIAIDNCLTGRFDNLLGLSANLHFRFIRWDIIEKFEIEGPLDFVFNLASPASPLDYAELPLETLRVGSIGTENGLKLAEKKRAVFLQASTSEVYGDPLVHPQREDYFGNVNPVGPRAVYDESKRYAEALVATYQRMGKAQTRIARIFNTYGPRMRLGDGRVVPAFISQALEGSNFTVFGDGTQTRSFCYVDDLVAGLMRLALSNVQMPVNLGNPVEMTMLQFVEAVRQAAGGGGLVVHQPLPENDPKQRRPDISRARTLLQWEPKVSLEEGLQKTLKYFRERAA